MQSRSLSETDLTRQLNAAIKTMRLNKDNDIQYFIDLMNCNIDNAIKLLDIVHQTIWDSKTSDSSIVLDSLRLLLQIRIIRVETVILCIQYIHDNKICGRLAMQCINEIRLYIIAIGNSEDEDINCYHSVIDRPRNRLESITDIFNEIVERFSKINSQNLSKSLVCLELIPVCISGISLCCNDTLIVISSSVQWRQIQISFIQQLFEDISWEANEFMSMANVLCEVYQYLDVKQLECLRDKILEGYNMLSHDSNDIANILLLCIRLMEQGNHIIWFQLFRQIYGASRSHHLNIEAILEQVIHQSPVISDFVLDCYLRIIDSFVEGDKADIHDLSLILLLSRSLRSRWSIIDEIYLPIHLSGECNESFEYLKYAFVFYKLCNIILSDQSNSTSSTIANRIATISSSSSESREFISIADSNSKFVKLLSIFSDSLHVISGSNNLPQETMWLSSIRCKDAISFGFYILCYNEEITQNIFSKSSSTIPESITVKEFVEELFVACFKYIPPCRSYLIQTIIKSILSCSNAFSLSEYSMKRLKSKINNKEYIHDQFVMEYLLKYFERLIHYELDDVTSNESIISISILKQYLPTLLYLNMEYIQSFLLRLFPNIYKTSTSYELSSLNDLFNELISILRKSLLDSDIHRKIATIRLLCSILLFVNESQQKEILQLLVYGFSFSLDVRSILYFELKQMLIQNIHNSMNHCNIGRLKSTDGIQLLSKKVSDILSSYLNCNNESMFLLDTIRSYTSTSTSTNTNTSTNTISNSNDVDINKKQMKALKSSKASNINKVVVVERFLIHDDIQSLLTLDWLIYMSQDLKGAKASLDLFIQYFQERSNSGIDWNSKDDIDDSNFHLNYLISICSCIADGRIWKQFVLSEDVEYCICCLSVFYQAIDGLIEVIALSIYFRITSSYTITAAVLVELSTICDILREVVFQIHGESEILKDCKTIRDFVFKNNPTTMIAGTSSVIRVVMDYLILELSSIDEGVEGVDGKDNNESKSSKKCIPSSVLRSLGILLSQFRSQPNLCKENPIEFFYHLVDVYKIFFSCGNEQYFISEAVEQSQELLANAGNDNSIRHSLIVSFIKSFPLSYSNGLNIWDIYIPNLDMWKVSSRKMSKLSWDSSRSMLFMIRAEILETISVLLKSYVNNTPIHQIIDLEITSSTIFWSEEFSMSIRRGLSLRSFRAYLEVLSSLNNLEKTQYHQLKQHPSYDRKIVISTLFDTISCFSSSQYKSVNMLLKHILSYCSLEESLNVCKKVFDWISSQSFTDEFQQIEAIEDDSENETEVLHAYRMQSYTILQPDATVINYGDGYVLAKPIQVDELDTPVDSCDKNNTSKSNNLSELKPLIQRNAIDAVVFEVFNFLKNLLGDSSMTCSETSRQLLTTCILHFMISDQSTNEDSNATLVDLTHEAIQSQVRRFNTLSFRRKLQYLTLIAKYLNTLQREVNFSIRLLWILKTKGIINSFTFPSESKMQEPEDTLSIHSVSVSPIPSNESSLQFSDKIFESLKKITKDLSLQKFLVSIISTEGIPQFKDLQSNLPSLLLELSNSIKASANDSVFDVLHKKKLIILSRFQELAGVFKSLETRILILRESLNQFESDSMLSFSSSNEVSSAINFIQVLDRNMKTFLTEIKLSKDEPNKSKVSYHPEVIVDDDEGSDGDIFISRSSGKRRTNKRLRSRNQVIDDWLRDERGQDTYADLEDFIV